MPEYQFYRSTVSVDDQHLTIRRKVAPGMPKELAIPLSSIRGAYRVPPRRMTNGRLKVVTAADDAVSVQSHTKSSSDPQVVMFLKKHAAAAEELYSWLVKVGNDNGGDLPVIETQDQAERVSEEQKAVKKAEREDEDREQAKAVKKAKRKAKSEARMCRFEEASKVKEAERLRPINHAVPCPKCQEKGQLHIRTEKQKKGFSTGKATAGVLTGGFSLLGTGLAKKGEVVIGHCDNCGLESDLS